MRDAVILLGGLWSKNTGFLEEVARRGLLPLVIDQLGPRTAQEMETSQRCPAHPLRLVHEHRLLSDQTIPAVLEAARDWHESYRVRGVHALREEYVESAGVCADYLGLPSPGLTAARVCRDKRLQRIYLQAYSPVSRRIQAGESVEEFDFVVDYPVVVKPPDGLASLDVQVCRDPASLAAKLAGHDPRQELLMEQFVQGQEVSVETLVQDERIAFCGITVKQTTQPGSDFCVEMSHTLGPDLLPPDIADAVRAVNSDVLRRLHFRNGLSHAEYMVTRERSVVLMEIAARNPGDSIVPMYHLATGRPMEAAILDIVLGIPAQYRPLRRYVRQKYLEHIPGQLLDVDVPVDLAVAPTWLRETAMRRRLTAGDMGDPATVREILVEKARGDTLRSPRSSMDRSVSVLFDAPSWSQLDATDRLISQNVRVRTRPIAVADRNVEVEPVDD